VIGRGSLAEPPAQSRPLRSQRSVASARCCGDPGCGDLPHLPIHEFTISIVEVWHHSFAKQFRGLAWVVAYWRCPGLRRADWIALDLAYITPSLSQLGQQQIISDG